MAAAASLVIAAGVIHGLRTDRWGADVNVAAAAARLDDVPLKVGEWEGRPIAMDDRQLAMAEAVGHMSRTYVSRRTGMEVTVVLLCGRPGPISLHSPEVCYAGAGFNMTGEEGTATVSGDGAPPAELFKATFVKPGAAQVTLNVFWAWRADGAWLAASNPRLTFARSTVLYKLYVIRRLARPDEVMPQEPCLDFLRAFLPELDKQLSPSA
jgi:hypothetical protein